MCSYFSRALASVRRRIGLAPNGEHCRRAFGGGNAELGSVASSAFSRELHQCTGLEQFKAASETSPHFIERKLT
jgi:hypothetical protein